MESAIENTYIVHLTLNEDEAKWLKGVVQNPIGCTHEDEDIRHAKHRKDLWDALKGVHV